MWPDSMFIGGVCVTGVCLYIYRVALRYWCVLLGAVCCWCVCYLGCVYMLFPNKLASITYKNYGLGFALRIFNFPTSTRYPFQVLGFPTFWGMFPLYVFSRGCVLLGCAMGCWCAIVTNNTESFTYKIYDLGFALRIFNFSTSTKSLVKTYTLPKKLCRK